MSATEAPAVFRLPCGCERDEPCHIVACHDDNVAACGADVTDANWCSDDPCYAPRCVVCYELDANEPDVCNCRCCVDEYGHIREVSG